MPIRKLPALLVNQIAAGEVIERPANVVKELLENAVDAGAGRIDVAVEEGGRQLIRVTDDGAGIPPEELPLAFEPHATSKIADADDLFRIGTLGFRGEALASIGAVSQARIVSRRRTPAGAAAEGSEGGFEIVCSADRIGEIRPAAAPPGTTVEVRNLFFNTPARRRFLKTDATEFGHIQEQVLRCALPYPGIHFTLTHNGRKVYDLPAGPDSLGRIRDFAGAETADALIPLDSPDRSARLTGWIAPPRDSRSTDRWQYVFLNGRFIRDRVLSAAVREAYRGLLEVHRKPVAFLFLVVDPADVDVNVHPTKIEVRFRNSSAVYRHVLTAVRERLIGTELAPELRLPEPPEPVAAGTPPWEAPGSTPWQAAVPAIAAGANRPDPDPAAIEQRERVRAAMADFFRTIDPSRARVAFVPTVRRDPPGHPDRPVAPALPPRIGADAGSSGGVQNLPGLAFARGPIAAVAESRPEDPEPAVGGPVPADAPDHTPAPPHPVAEAGPRYRAVQLHNAFIVAETPDGLIVVDQHALHERILYEQLKGKVEHGGLPGQRLLLPDRVEMSPRRAAALAECRELLARLGIEVDDFGNGTAAVQTFPTLLKRADPARFVGELLDGLSERDGRATPEMLLHAVIDMAACKAAVKAGDPLTPGEIDALLARREAVENHHTCAHGRPTTLKLTVRELERQFKRH